MAINYVNSGERLNYSVPKDKMVASGDIVVLEGRCYIALSRGIGGDEVTLSRVGRFTLPKDSSVIRQGQTLHYCERRNLVMSNGSLKIGIAACSAESSMETAECILVQGI